MGYRVVPKDTGPGSWNGVIHLGSWCTQVGQERNDKGPYGREGGRRGATREARGWALGWEAEASLQS